MTNIDSQLKSRDITLPIKVCLVKAVVFLGVMYGCESWMNIKELVLSHFGFGEDLWNLLDCKEIKPVILKETNCVLIGRTVADIEASLLWSPDLRNWLIRKDHDAGKDWRQKQKRVVEDELDFCPWGFADKDTGVDWHFLSQVIFPTQGLNPHPLGLLYFWWIFYLLSHPASPNLSILVHKELSYSF